MLAWLAERKQFPPLLLLRRYLKLAVAHATEAGLMDCPLDAAPSPLPFSLTHVPRNYPPPPELRLWIVALPEE